MKNIIPVRYFSVKVGGFKVDSKSLADAINKYIKTPSNVYKYTKMISPTYTDKKEDIIGRVVGFDDKYMYIKPCEGKESEFKHSEILLGWVENERDEINKTFTIKRITTMRLKKGSED